MRELRFDGLSPEGDRLVLAGKDGQKYTVAIDERLVAAVRRDRARMSQVEIEQAGVLRPREIQARIRSGATAEDVAAASGLPIEHVRRFEGPVLTERAWVAQQAQATEVRRPGGDIELGDLVAERLQEQGVDPVDIAWDAWRRDDGRWVVIATFPIHPNTHVATWTYDSGSRTMTVADDNARALSAITADEPLHLAATRPLLASVAALGEEDVEDYDEEYGPATILTPRRGHPSGPRGVPTDEESDDTDADEFEEVGDELGDPAADWSDEDEASHVEPATSDDEASAEDAEPERDATPDEDANGQPEDGPTLDAEDVPLFDAPAPHRPAGRPSVPSFDDILFGPGPSK